MIRYRGGYNVQKRFLFKVQKGSLYKVIGRNCVFFCLKGALYKVHWSILIKIKVHWSKMPLPYNRPLYSGLTSHKKNEVLLRLSRSRAMALHNILVFFLILKFLTFLILYFFQLEIMLGWIFRD